MKQEAKKDNTAGGNLLLCPVPLRKIGKRQRAVLKRMAAGWHISMHRNFSAFEEFVDLSDEDGNTSEEISPSILISFCKREIVEYKTVYTTIQPDTETGHYVLKREYLDYVRRHWA